MLSSLCASVWIWRDFTVIRSVDLWSCQSVYELWSRGFLSRHSLSRTKSKFLGFWDTTGLVHSDCVLELGVGKTRTLIQDDCMNPYATLLFASIDCVEWRIVKAIKKTYLLLQWAVEYCSLRMYCRAVASRLVIQPWFGLPDYLPDKFCFLFVRGYVNVL